MAEVLSARAVSLSFGARRVLHSLDLSLEAGEVLGLIGPNGAGKTSVLRVLAGLVAPDAGVVSVAPALVAPAAPAIGYLPQLGEVHWPLAVERIVALGRLPHLPPLRGPGRADAARIEAAMRATDVLHLIGRSVLEISGGERARVLLARVLAGDPAVILADEPVAGLDPRHQLDVMSLFRSEARRGRAVAMALHDLSLASRFCDRVLLIDAGVAIAIGPPAEVLTETMLADVYGVTSLFGQHGNERYVLPWAPLDDRLSGEPPPQVNHEGEEERHPE